MAVKRTTKPKAVDVDPEKLYVVALKTYESMREHILDRPEAYGGSKQLMERQERALTEEGVKSLLVQSTRISRRVFEEAINNLTDAAGRAQEHRLPIGRQEVVLSPQRVSVYNESAYIPIVQTTTKYEDETGQAKERTEWDPFRCFGRLLTSSNYNDDQERTTVGKNGVGGHLLPIFSSYFDLEDLDPQRKLRYTQVWRRNASVVEPPIIEKWATFPVADGRKCGSVRVTWVLSPKSGVAEYSEDVLKLFRKIVADASFTSNLPFHLIEYASGDETGWHGEGVETLYDYRGEAYFALYPRLHGLARCSFEYKGSRVTFFDTPAAGINEAWVNGGYAPEGVHVRAWRLWFYRMLHAILKTRENAKELLQQASLTKGKSKAPTKAALKAAAKDELTDKALEKLYDPHISLFLVCTLVKPAYTSQTKEELTGPTPEVPPLTGKGVPTLVHSGDEGFATWRVFDEVEAALRAKLKRKAIKDGGKRTEFVYVEGAEDAEWAGTKNSHLCALILTEGKSGVTIATKGAQMLNPKAYGVNPIQGKPANLMQNPGKSAELVRDLTKLLGWAPGKTRKDLRYNRLLLMTDADPDGIHIRLLLILLFYVAFPGLLEEGFIEAFIYPIVTVERRGQTLAFYSMQAFEIWCQNNEGGRGWRPKYFKGLGSCTDGDIKYAFTHPVVVKYTFDPQALNNLELAFAKGKENARKQWLVEYDPLEVFVYPEVLEVSTSIKRELPIFSIYECQRAISCIMDGLNLGQRKVVHVIRTSGITNEDKLIKVKQLAGKVANDAAYHHNEDILMDTIHRLGSTVAGHNNLPLLVRNGEFGSRLANGKDAANGRYTFVYGSSILKVLFTTEDDSILQWGSDDGKCIEPSHYYSIIALVLANHQEGIGCGSNSKVPCYNPRELLERHKLACDAARRARLGEELVDQPLPMLLPWARYYRGSITLERGRIMDRGVFYQRGSIIHVTEVPLGMSYNDYVVKLNVMKATLLDDAKAGRGTDLATKRKLKAEGKAALLAELKGKAKGKGSKAASTAAKSATAKGKGKGKAHVEEAEEAEDEPEEEPEEDEAPVEGGVPAPRARKPKAVRLLKSHKHEAYHLKQNGDDHCHFELKEFGLVPTHKNLKLETTIGTTQLTLFDEEGKLHHFETPELLLEHYSRVMMETRDQMRLKRIEECTAKVAELELKVQFVAEVIRNPLLVAGRKDSELKPWMESRGYPDAFLNIQLRSITDAMKGKVIKQLADERVTLAHYESIGGEQLWLEQLQAFEAVYNKLYPA